MLEIKIRGEGACGKSHYSKLIQDELIKSGRKFKVFEEGDLRVLRASELATLDAIIDVAISGSDKIKVICANCGQKAIKP